MNLKNLNIALFIIGAILFNFVVIYSAFDVDWEMGFFWTSIFLIIDGYVLRVIRKKHDNF